MDGEMKAEKPGQFDRRFAVMSSTSTRSERRALLRRSLADLAVAMAEAETEIAYAEMRRLFEANLEIFRAGNPKMDVP